MGSWSYRVMSAMRRSISCSKRGHFASKLQRGHIQTLATERRGREATQLYAGAPSQTLRHGSRRRNINGSGSTSKATGSIRAGLT